MIQIKLPSRYSKPESSAGGRYRLAGEVVAVDGFLPELVPFVSRDAAARRRAPRPAAAGTADGYTFFAGPGWIGNRYRGVVMHSVDGGWRVEIDDIGALVVAPDSSVTWVEGPQGPEADRWVSEATLGPGLILALALRGVFCLHASAVLAPDGGVVGFLGPSGAGKSTLARLLDGAPGGWRRAADDVVPVRWADDHGEPAVLPRFPQLKLSSDRQPGAGLPESASLTGLFLLSPGDAADVRCQPLSRTNAALALLRHTVAARLFSSELLERHLSFCTRLAQRLDVMDLGYPRRGRVVPGLLEAIAPRWEVA